MPIYVDLDRSYLHHRGVMKTRAIKIDINGPQDRSSEVPEVANTSYFTSRSWPRLIAYLSIYDPILVVMLLKIRLNLVCLSIIMDYVSVCFGLS